jgi:hypothetical protein
MRPSDLMSALTVGLIIGGLVFFFAIFTFGSFSGAMTAGGIAGGLAFAFTALGTIGGSN